MNHPNFKIPIWQPSISVAIALVTLGFQLPSTPAQTLIQQGLTQSLPHRSDNDDESNEPTLPGGGLNRPPDPPSDPPPNQTRPGGGLNPLASCNALNDGMRALVPLENPVLTTAEHPTFLFYVPFGADEVQFGEFSILLWPREQQRLYKTRFTLPQRPGIVSITLPNRPEYVLEEGQYYHWYFQLYCQDNTNAEPDLGVNGWIQRVPLTPDRERQIQTATPEIWYDALATIADGLQASPQDTQLQQAWRNLLQAIDAEDLLEETLVTPVIPLKD